MTPDELPIFTQTVLGVRLMTLYQFLSGSIMACSFVIALFFFRFWSRTQDKLFGTFAFAFVLLGIERFALLFFNMRHEAHPLVYTFRLLAFSLIIFAIIQKNREGNRK